MEPRLPGLLKRTLVEWSIGRALCLMAAAVLLGQTAGTEPAEAQNGGISFSLPRDPEGPPLRGFNELLLPIGPIAADPRLRIDPCDGCTGLPRLFADDRESVDILGLTDLAITASEAGAYSILFFHTFPSVPPGTYPYGVRLDGTYIDINGAIFPEGQIALTASVRRVSVLDELIDGTENGGAPAGSTSFSLVPGFLGEFGDRPRIEDIVINAGGRINAVLDLVFVTDGDSIAFPGSVLIAAANREGADGLQAVQEALQTVPSPGALWLVAVSVGVGLLVQRLRKRPSARFRTASDS